MLDMQLHSCSNLAHDLGYSSDNGSFKDCVVSHCVQMCLSYFFSAFVPDRKYSILAVGFPTSRH